MSTAKVHLDDEEKVRRAREHWSEKKKEFQDPSGEVYP